MNKHAQGGEGNVDRPVSDEHCRPVQPLLTVVDAFAFQSGDDDGRSGGRFKKKPCLKADRLAAKEMNELSLQERESIYEEIHGIPRVIEESPSVIHPNLAALEKQLSMIAKKPAYDRALFLSPKYVQDPKLRLAFVRAERFSCSKAARRMVDYFEMKLSLFGPEKLVKTISMDDLDEADKTILLEGSTYFLPEKDRSGRAILFHRQPELSSSTDDNHSSSRATSKDNTSGQSTMVRPTRPQYPVVGKKLKRKE